MNAVQFSYRRYAILKSVLPKPEPVTAVQFIVDWKITVVSYIRLEYNPNCKADIRLQTYFIGFGRVGVSQSQHFYVVYISLAVLIVF